MERLEEGLTIILGKSGDQEMLAHAYMVSVPGCDKGDYSDADIETLEKDLGWAWSDDFGWVFPCIS